jgi:hypothetical protein
MIENLKTTKYRNGDLIGTTLPATLDIHLESTPNTNGFMKVMRAMFRLMADYIHGMQ